MWLPVMAWAVWRQQGSASAAEGYNECTFYSPVDLGSCPGTENCVSFAQPVLVLFPLNAPCITSGHDGNELRPFHD